MDIIFQIASLFILMALGYFFSKKGLIHDSAIKSISNLVVYGAMPALILTSMQVPFTKELLHEALIMMLVSFLFYSLLIFLSFYVARLFHFPPLTTGAITFALAFSNASFMGFPVIRSILGEQAFFLTSINNMMFNLFAFSIGTIIISGRWATISIQKVLNVNVLTAVAGFTFFVVSYSIPHVFMIPLSMLGNITTPLAMIVTGALLARSKLKNVFGNWKLYLVSIIRLLLWPAIIAIVLWLCGIRGYIFYISVIIAGMPSGSNTSMLAEVYGGDSETASNIVFLTTIFSIITIPLLAMCIRSW